jgi:oligoendopeptidase F
MFETLPATPQAILASTWATFEPFFQSLQQRELQPDSIQGWLADWSRLASCIFEMQARLGVAVSINTADAEAERRYNAFYDEVFPRVMEAEQALKQKLLASGLQPEGYAIPLRNMRAEADLYRAENLPLQSEESKFRMEYDKIIGAQTITWEGQERTVDQMKPVYQDTDQARRERAWRMVARRQLADREAINQVWVKLFDLRRKIAENAGRPDYRAYAWQAMLRFDYTSQDAGRFHDAIEEVVVPAARRVYERRRKQLGLDTLRPWDLDVEPSGLPPLRPFRDAAELRERSATIFHQVDPALGAEYDILVKEDLMDLDNRKNKSPGAFCTSYPVAERPYIVMNAVGMHDNVQTLLHESGHAFHVFATNPLSNLLRNVPTEFAEVASMGMELLASPYITRDKGGFYTPAEAARARIEHLEGNILFWPYMAVVDAFQQWAYTHPDVAVDPVQCDANWLNLWRRFMQGVDWSGLEDVEETGWHRKVHLYSYPFYYIEYGLAQLGAVQVWGNALKDQAGAVASYRRALALGGTVTLPELFQTAGARFAFDAAALRQAVALIEEQIEILSQSLSQR